MSSSRRQLRDDEEVLLDTRPHWAPIFRPVFSGACILGACIATFVIWRSAPTWFGIVLGVMLLSTIGVVGGRIVSWRATHLVVTTRRVTTRRGVLHRVGREIPLERVQDVTFHQRLLQRIIGSGSLEIESAGERGLEAISHVRRPAEVQRLINEAQSARSTPTTIETPAGAQRVAQEVDGAPAAVQLEQLVELRRRGILTEVEFEAKRQELLRRL